MMRPLLFLVASVVAMAQSQSRMVIIPKQDNSATGTLEFREKYGGSGNAVGFQAPDSIASTVIWKLPAADNPGCFQSDGAGVMLLIPCQDVVSDTNDTLPIIRLYNSSGGGQPCVSFNFDIADGNDVTMSRVCSQLANGASGSGRANLQFYGTHTAGDVSTLVKNAEFVGGGALNIYKGLRISADGVAVADIVGSDFAAWHTDLPTNWVQATVEGWNVNTDNTDNAAIRGVLRVKGGSHVQSRAVEAITTREATAGDSWYTWGAEIHVHSAVEPVPDSTMNVGIYVHDICELLFAGGCAVEKKNNIGVYVGGTSGWEYGFQYRDTTDAIKLFYADEHGNVAAHRALIAYGAVGQTLANYDTSGTHGGAALLRDKGNTAGAGGVVLIGAEQGYYAAIKGSMTNGSGPIGDLSISLRIGTSDPTLTEMVKVRPVGIDADPAGVPDYYFKTRRLALSDQSGGIPFWDLRANASSSVSSLELRDNSGDTVFLSYRQLAGSPLNATYWFTSLLPDKRSTGAGHTVTDTVNPDLGAFGSRWHYIYGDILDVLSAYVRTIYLEIELLPQMDLGAKIGTSSSRFSQVYSEKLFALGAGQTFANINTAGALGGSVILQDTGASAGNGGAAIFGSAQGYFAAIKGSLTNGIGNTMGDLSISLRTATGATTLTEMVKVSTTGINADPAIANYYFATRKLALGDVNANGSAYWELYGSATSLVKTIEIKDPSGDPVFRTYRQLGGSAENQTDWYTHLIPQQRSTGAGHSVSDAVNPSLGSSSDRWQYVYADFVDAATLVSAYQVYVTDLLVPLANLGADIGTSLNRFNNVYVHNLEVSGTCTGCGTVSAPLTLTLGATDYSEPLTVANNTAGVYGSCVVVAATDTVATVRGAGRFCGRYDSPSFADELVTIQTVTGASTYQNALELKNQAVTVPGTLAVGSTLTMGGNILASSDGGMNIGASSANRPAHAWFTGTVTAEGISAIANSTSFVRARKLEVHMSGTGTAGWSWQFAGANNLELRDSGSNLLVAFDAQVAEYFFAGAVYGTGTLGLSATRWSTAYITNLDISGTVNGNLIPSTNNNRTLGSSSFIWNYLYANAIEVTSFIEPRTNGGAQLGFSSKRFSDIYTQALDISGDVSGNLIPSSDNTYVLGSSIKRWAQINLHTIDIATFGGSGNVVGNLIPGINNAYNLGTTSLRWSSLNVVNMNASGSVQALSGAFALATVGELDATGGALKAPSGSYGYSGTINVRKADDSGSCSLTVSGGLITSHTC